MKLINDFFEVIETSINETGFITSVKLNSSHIIYKGHFPGHPVTPGVIQMQIVHELLEKHFDRNLKLMTMPQCKFLKILDPINDSQLFVHIDFNKNDELLDIRARGENGNDVFFKLNAAYQFV